MQPWRLFSWNVNGIRACVRKGFLDWLAASQAEVVALQEVRASAAQAGEALAPGLAGWHLHVESAAKPGYSGVALLSRRPPDAYEARLGEARFDREGRYQLARWGRFVLINGYFPNGSGPNRDHSRIPYKLAFTEAVRARAEAERRRGRRVVVVGDFNTAHKAIDLARPKANTKTSGFTAREREALDLWPQAGWVDLFRRFEPGPEHYTWWSQRGTARARNVGWRIDYVFASAAAARHATHATHRPQVLGSDHCPVEAVFNPSLLSG